MDSETPFVNTNVEPPLSLGRAQLSLWLGLAGMILYGLMLHLAMFGGFRRRLFVESDMVVTVLPLLAAVGCACFLGALVLVWRFRMLTLMILTAGSSLLVGLVVMVQEHNV